ncbi:hypothetical protein [Streptomyces sp. NPDC094149]|uniref:hypothetical protein n=1 Tax=Streptomyces sp. NPDC094149 TaxID=3155079 RepID=UPI00332D1732
MTSHGQAAAAVATAAAERLRADLLQRGALGLSVLGMLYLKAAIAQAVVAEADDRSPDAAARTVPLYLDQADEHAAQLGVDGNELWTSFGPTNCALYRVAAQNRSSRGWEQIWHRR